MPGNPLYGLAADSIRASWEGEAEVHLHAAQVEATLALAFEVRTVALLLASSMAGTADSADGQYETAMRRMGETDEQ